MEFDYNSWNCSFDTTSNWGRSCRARLVLAGSGNLVVHLGKMHGDMGSCSCLNLLAVDRSCWGRNCPGTCRSSKLERCRERQVGCLAVKLKWTHRLVSGTLMNRRVLNEGQFHLDFLNFQFLWMKSKVRIENRSTHRQLTISERLRTSVDVSVEHV